MRTLTSNLPASMWFAIIGCLLLIATGCSPQSAPPSSATAVQQLDIVDKQGRHYGTMEMTSLGGAKVYDASGQMIGEIASSQ